MKTLCDRCKIEFDCDESELTNYDGSPAYEVICPQCKEDCLIDFL